MSKKTNTLLFILGGTIFNILVTVLCFILLLVFYSAVLAKMLPENSGAWVMPVIFMASIIASFFLYKFVIKLIMKKIDMDKYFDPIFGPRRPPRKQ